MEIFHTCVRQLWIVAAHLSCKPLGQGACGRTRNSAHGPCQERLSTAHYTLCPGAVSRVYIHTSFAGVHAHLAQIGPVCRDAQELRSAAAYTSGCTRASEHATVMGAPHSVYRPTRAHSPAFNCSAAWPKGSVGGVVYYARRCALPCGRRDQAQNMRQSQEPRSLRCAVPEMRLEHT